MRLIDPLGFYCELFRIFFVSHGRGQSLYLTVGRFYGFPHIKKLFLALVVKSNGGSDPVSDIPY